MKKHKILRVITLLFSILILGSATAPVAFAGTSVMSSVGRHGFPATGFQIAVAVAVAVVLIAGGIALRRWSRSQRP